MGCAAFGNLASVIVGVLMGERVEKLAAKLGDSSCLAHLPASQIFGIYFHCYFISRFDCLHVAGLPPHGLSLAQLEHASANRVKTTGSVIGVIIGCLIGMLPLYWIDHADVKDKKRP
jgi:hypothetical protein